MRFIKVRSGEGEIYINADKIEMVIPKKFGPNDGCALRMNERLFINVFEPIEDVVERLNNK